MVGGHAVARGVFSEILEADAVALADDQPEDAVAEWRMADPLAFLLGHSCSRERNKRTTIGGQQPHGGVPCADDAGGNLCDTLQHPLERLLGDEGGNRGDQMLEALFPAVRLRVGRRVGEGHAGNSTASVDPKRPGMFRGDSHSLHAPASTMRLTSERSGMQLRYILAAADDSDEGRAAIYAALALARTGVARVTVLRVNDLPEDAEHAKRLHDHLRAAVQAAQSGDRTPLKVESEVVTGLPGIEIGRFAERMRADLIVVGRKQRSDADRLRLGDTADAVARRSSMPCLLVPGGDQSFGRVLASLDGSERGMHVLHSAIGFARATGARLGLVSVEPATDGDEAALGLPTARTTRLQQVVHEVRTGMNQGAGLLAVESSDSRIGPLTIRRGPVVAEVIREVETSRADVLVVGYHRGGPAGPLEAGDICRRLARESPSAVLTVPL